MLKYKTKLAKNRKKHRLFPFHAVHSGVNKNFWLTPALST